MPQAHKVAASFVRLGAPNCRPHAPPVPADSRWLPYGGPRLSVLRIPTARALSIPCLAWSRAPHADRRGDRRQQRAGALLRSRPIRQMAIRPYAFAPPVADCTGLWRGNPPADHRPSAEEQFGSAFAFWLSASAAALLLPWADILLAQRRASSIRPCNGEPGRARRYRGG